MGAILTRLHEAADAFRGVFANRGLRNLELAWAGSELGSWAATVTVAVYAFKAGGTAAVGLVGLIRMLPAAFAAPFTAILADRYPRRRVMILTDLVRAAATAGAAATAFVAAPAALVYGLVAFVALASTAFHPAQAAVVPSLATNPEELTAANVSSTTIESVASFVGPALGGAVVGLAGTGTAFAVTAVTFVWSACLLARIPGDDATEREAGDEGVVSAALAGFRAIFVDPALRLLMALFAAQTLVWGALTVLIVVTAIDLLDLGDAGVGYLYSAIGVGGLVGAVAAVGLVGQRRLASAFGLAALAWGLPIALVGAWPQLGAAAVFLAVVGAANTLLDVAGVSLLQRAVPDVVLARVFGVLGSLVLLGTALGSVVAPAIVAAFGTRGALVATGLFLPVLTAAAWPTLRRIDAAGHLPEAELALLRSQPLFAPLPGPTLEHLAGSLQPVVAAAGQDIIRAGEAGDRFYLVASGELDVLLDGAEDARLGAGDSFGEIALLRNVRRTATVRAATDARLYALERDVFLAAVTGHPASTEAANAVVAARMGGIRADAAHREA